MGVAELTARGEVTIQNLSKSYSINGRHLNVLQGVSNHVEAGEILAIVGASGSGKTTLLRVLAGLEDADRGEVLIDGRPVRGVGTDRAVIFQEPRLLPWLTVLDNVALPLENRGISKVQARNQARQQHISLAIIMLDLFLGQHYQTFLSAESSPYCRPSP